MINLITKLKDFEESTRPVSPTEQAALAERWNALPVAAQTSGQILGRRSTGCEGTHGVFPKCNFSCKPCYHSADANRVRIDGPHTIAQVTKQMSYLNKRRGYGQFAQLIGGEVSLLNPDDHAECLTVMRAHGRMPMSFTHGDFDYSYLRRLTIGADGTPRLGHVAFAAHFDSTMVGRSGIKKPQSEAELHDARGRFCDMFKRLKVEFGVTSYLAHNMTVTPANVDQVADVVAQCRDQGWRLFSFQPAAYVGDPNRWRDDYRSIQASAVWREIEHGANSVLSEGRLPYEGLRFGDIRCNRVTWGAYTDGRYIPIIDDKLPSDMAVAAKTLAAFPGSMVLQGRFAGAVRVARSVAATPSTVPSAARWTWRFSKRAGGLRSARRLSPVTFVMHRFIDARHSKMAWSHMQAGTRATEPDILEAQERLEACAYSMAHPDSDQLVPACVQHGVLDPDENRSLVKLLPTRLAMTRKGSKDVGWG